MTRGETLLIKELKREMGSTEPLLEEEIERLEENNKRLKEKNKKLQEVIDKAIEYITSAIENDDIEELKSARHLMLWNEDLDKLLEILKGSE